MEPTPEAPTVMVWNAFTRGVVLVLVTLVVLASVAVGAVAADDHDDDGLLGGDDDGLVDADEENASVGGDDGVSVGSDGVNVGDTSVGTDDAPDGADDPVEEVTDAADGAGDDHPTDEVDAGNLTDGAGVGNLTDGATITNLTDGRNVENATDAGNLTDPGDVPDLLDGADGLVGEGGAVDTRNVTVNPDELPGGDGPLPDADAPTELLGRSAGTDDLPADEVPADRLPATGEDAPVEPEDLAYGSEGDGLFAACTLPVTDEDLPTEAAPDPGDLPVEPSVPGVPVNLVTADTVASIAFGVPPRPCNVYDPHDPSVDPTAPPTSPTSKVSSEVVEVDTDIVRYVGDADGQLENGGVAYDSLYGVQADDDSVSGTETVDVTDGRTDDYLLVQSYAVGRYVDQRGTLWTRVGLFGRYASAELACDDVDPGNHTLDEPTGECDYEVEGVPNPPSGPGDVVDTIRNPPEPELPIDPDEIADEIDGLPET